MSATVTDAETLTERLLAHGRRRRYPARTTIIYAGDHPDLLYLILDGSVSVLFEDPDGQNIVLAYLNEGDFFGEMGLFDEDGRRSAWIKARTDCEVLEIPYGRFRELIEADSRLLMLLTAQLARRLQKTSQKVGDLAFVDVAGRIARALLDLSRQPDARTHAEGVQVEITRQELAAIAGCAREMAGKALKLLEDQGHIRIQGKTILVLRE